MVKVTISLRRKPTLTREKFAAYHRERHAKLFCALPVVKQHVRRYVQCHAVPADIAGLPPNAFDGTTELWFDDVAGLEAVFSSASYMRLIRPDEAAFLDLDGCRFMLGTDTAVIPSGEAA